MNMSDLMKQRADTLKHSQESAIERIREDIAQDGSITGIVKRLHRLREFTGNPISNGWGWNRSYTCPDCKADLLIYRFYHGIVCYKLALCECGFIWGKLLILGL